jgi:hypothetical protein
MYLIILIIYKNILKIKFYIYYTIKFYKILYYYFYKMKSIFIYILLITLIVYKSGQVTLNFQKKKNF